MRILTFFLLTMLLTIVLSSPPGLLKVASATDSPALSASLSNGFASVSIALHVNQNLTFLDRSFELPQFNGFLVGQNATAVSAIVQDSLRAESSGASVSNLSLGLSSSPPTNGNILQWFNVSLQFQVRGIQTSQNGNEITDMSWKSFVISSNVTIGPVEVNHIGSAYMLDAAQFIALLEAPAQGTFAYRNLINDRIVTPVGLSSAISKVQLLNFTRFLPNVDAWQKGYDYASKSVTWSMDAGPGLGFVVQQTNNEPHATEKIFSGIFYSLVATVSAPAKSFAQGDSIVTAFQDTSETIMGTAIVSVIVLGSFAYIYESRVLNKSGRRSRR